MMIENISHTMFDWLRDNAPARVVDLFNDQDSMRLYVSQVRKGGKLQEWAGDEIAESVVDAANAMADLGASFVDAYGIGHSRTPASEPEPADPQLDELRAAWPNLTDDERAHIVAIVLARIGDEEQ